MLACASCMKLIAGRSLVKPLPEGMEEDILNTRSNVAAHHKKMDSGLQFREAPKVTSLSEKLISAVKAGDLTTVDFMLAKDLSLLNCKGMWNSTPLLIAVQYNHEALALHLLNHYSYLPINSNGGNSPTKSMSSTDKDSHFMRRLDTLSINDKNASALLHGCLNGMTSVVESILVQFPGIMNTTCFHTISPNIYNPLVDVSGAWDALSCLCANGNTDILELMESQDGFDIKIFKTFSFSLSIPFNEEKLCSTLNGITPLMVACVYGQAALVSFLLNKGCDISAVDSTKANLFHHAARGRNANAVLNALFSSNAYRYLIRRSQQMELLMRGDEYGYTPLHYLISRKKVDIPLIELYLKECKEYSNFDVHKATSGAATRVSGQPLLSMARFNVGSTLLHVAILKRSFECVELLLQYGADPLRKDGKNQTCLELAEKGSKSSVNVSIIDTLKSFVRHSGEMDLEQSQEKKFLFSEVSIDELDKADQVRDSVSPKGQNMTDGSIDETRPAEVLQ